MQQKQTELHQDLDKALAYFEESLRETFFQKSFSQEWFVNNPGWIFTIYELLEYTKIS